MVCEANDSQARNFVHMWYRRRLKGSFASERRLRLIGDPIRNDQCEFH
jgi:hypothetical protein